MPPPRKPGSANQDPERANATIAKAPNPLVEEDPEVANATQARAPMPTRGKGSADPERENRTQARASNPVADPERENRTQARASAPPPPKGKRRDSKEAKAPSAEQDEEGYSTGSNFPIAGGDGGGDGDEEGLAGSVNLDGDGLDPVDPEMVPKTRVLQMPERKSTVEREAEADAEAEAPPSDGGDDEAADENATRAGPPVRLEIVGGPDQGKKRRFKGVRMVIGRTPGVDLQLSDQSVSRRHVELVHGDKGTVLRDLGSGNGTKVNGSKVAEKVLEDGDEIHIGKTKIRYVDEMAAFKKAREAAEKKEKAEAEAAKDDGGDAGEDEAEDTSADAKGEGGDEGDEGDDGEDGGDSEDDAADEEGERKASSKPKKGRTRSRPVRTSRSEAPSGPIEKFKALPPVIRAIALGGVSVVILVLFIAIITAKPPPPPIDQNKVKAEELMTTARTAVREGKFEEAMKAATEAEKLAPGIDKSKIAASAKEELDVLNTFAEARGLLEKRRFEELRALLEKAPKGSGRLDSERQKLDEEIAKAEIEYKKEQLDQFLSSGDVEAARRVLGELPVDQQAAPATKIAEFERQLEEIKKEEERTSKMGAAAAAAARKQRREEEMQVAFAIVERKFAGAEWDRAASECNRVVDAAAGDKDIVARAQKLNGLIPNFGRNYEEGVKKFKQGQLSSAAKPLRAAHQLYAQMGLRQNSFGTELEQKLAQASLAAGKEALLRDDLESAAQNFRDATRLDPSEPKGRQGLDDVIARAEDLYQSAYMARDRDPRDALRKFKTVVAVTPAGSATHEKAKNQIAAMSP